MWDYKKSLDIDPAVEATKIGGFIRRQVRKMKRSGAVIGLSGGLDSAVCSVLCCRALGVENVLGVILPEKESNPLSKELAILHAQQLGIKTEIMDITAPLESMGVYSQRDRAVRELIPEYDERSQCKIILPGGLLQQDAFNFFKLVVKDKDQTVYTKRLDSRSLRLITALTNMKQRMRMLHLYYCAEVNNYVVCGTTNRDENIQGFFVKYGDSGVDIEPIQNLYKTQVYRLASYLGVSERIIERIPSPDTFSFVVTDEEMHFRMPYEKVDPLLYAWEHKIGTSQVCEALGLSREQVERVFRDFESKFAATEYLRLGPASPALRKDK